jgi:VIT1/CCC1 family predicted Fe2+/Mn2+ transporter
MSEVLFGLIMALTFTTTLELTAARSDVRMLLLAVTGCNIAWGLVDAVMFLISTLTERGHGFLTIRAVRSATGEEAHRAITGALPPVLAGILTRDDVDQVRQRVLAMPDVSPPTLTRDDWLGALAVFLLVVLSTWPVVVPFLLVADVPLAIRLSNAVAILMMFGIGYSLARHAGFSPWWTGLAFVALGVVLVAITIALGG